MPYGKHVVRLEEFGFVSSGESICDRMALCQVDGVSLRHVSRFQCCGRFTAIAVVSVDGKPAAGELRYLTYDCGACSLLVSLQSSWFFWVAWIEAVLRHGERGVNVFFVISGFVISLALTRGGTDWSDVRAFLCGRFVRLYPAYFLAGLLATALWFLSAQLPGFRGDAPRMSGRQILGNLFMVCDLIGEDWLVPVF